MIVTSLGTGLCDHTPDPTNFLCAAITLNETNKQMHTHTHKYVGLWEIRWPFL